ncbi:MAG: hypothetical protein GX818_05465 [Tissierellia bacterium]|jgi:hypothetical protein|nr:hypothetical protein [Tissierellia bacterium]
MKAQSKEKLINILVSAGISKDEAIAVLHVIKQGNKLTKPDYIITVEYGEKVDNPSMDFTKKGTKQ